MLLKCPSGAVITRTKWTTAMYVALLRTSTGSRDHRRLVADSRCKVLYILRSPCRYICFSTGETRAGAGYAIPYVLPGVPIG